MKALLKGLGGVAKITFGIIGAIIVLGIIIAVAASKSKTSSGATSSPALVTTSTHTAAAKPQTFTGNGLENLGTINVPVASTLRWSCPGCSVFGVTGTAGVNYIAVDSSGHTSGVTAVEPGTYHSVSVTADEEGSGGWRITITPGS